MEQTETTNQNKKQSPNLLNRELFEQNPLVEKFHIHASVGAKILIITTQIIYLVFLGYNSRVIQQINDLENQVDVHHNQLLEEQETINQIVKTINKTEKLKTLQENRREFSPILEKALGLLPENSNLISSSFEKNVFDLTIQTRSALGISVLTANYFSEDLAENITIRSAVLNTEDNTFTTSMSINLK